MSGHYLPGNRRPTPGFIPDSPAGKSISEDLEGNNQGVNYGRSGILFLYSKSTLTRCK
jgi:hypothetical protein